MKMLKPLPFGGDADCGPVEPGAGAAQFGSGSPSPLLATEASTSGVQGGYVYGSAFSLDSPRTGHPGQPGPSDYPPCGSSPWP